MMAKAAKSADRAIGRSPEPTHVPEIVQCRLDPSDEGDHRVEQTCDTESAEDANVHTTHEIHHSLGQLGGLRAERGQHSGQQWLEAVLNAERFEHRERDGEKRHQ